FCTSAKMFFLTNDYVVKHTSGNFPTFFDVLIATVAHTGNDSDFMRRIYIAQEIFNRQITLRIMCKINHNLKVLEIENVHSSWCLRCTWNESLQGQTQIF